MTLFQYVDQEIDKRSNSKSSSWKRKHSNALNAVKKYCNGVDRDILSMLQSGWLSGLNDYYSDPELFSESTSKQYKDIFKSLYASAINNGLLPIIKLCDLCSRPWDAREEQEYKGLQLLNQIKILDYKNLDKEQSALRDLYFLSIACKGTDISTLLSLKKSDLKEDILQIRDKRYRIPQILLERLKDYMSKSDNLLSRRVFYKGEAKDTIRAIINRIKALFKSLNLNLFQWENLFIDWVIIAREAGIKIEELQKIISSTIADTNKETSKSETENTKIPKVLSKIQEDQVQINITDLVFRVTEKLEVLTANWYLVRILKNHLTGEGLVEKLSKDGIISFKSDEYYAPVYKVKTIHNGVTKIVNSSETSKMLFVRTSLKYAQKIDRLDEGGITVARNIRGGKFAIIPKAELQRMRDFLEINNDEIFLLQNADYIGRRIVVTKGPYTGWEGEIVKKKPSAIDRVNKPVSKGSGSSTSVNSHDDYQNTIFIVHFLNSLKWAVPVSGLEFEFID